MPATRVRAESWSMLETPVAKTSAARVTPACATSCSAVPASESKDAANLSVMTPLTRSRYSGMAPCSSSRSGP